MNVADDKVTRNKNWYEKL